MATPLGFKTFATGEVLTAGDTNGYLMQGIWVFASAAARDAAVTSPQEGNFAYLKDTNVTTYYTGSAWANLDTTGMTNPMTTTGDTIYSSSGSTPARLGIGSTGQVLTVAAGIPSWATPASGGGMTLLSTTTLSGAATTVSSIDQTYKNLQIVIINAYASGANNSYIQFNSDTGSNYGYRFNNSGSADQGSAVAFAYLGAFGTTQGYYDGSYVSITIPRYSETEYKSTIFTATKGNNLYLGNNSWNNTAAITAITIGVTASQTMSGGTMYIYGVK